MSLRLGRFLNSTAIGIVMRREAFLKSPSRPRRNGGLQMTNVQMTGFREAGIMVSQPLYCPSIGATAIKIIEASTPEYVTKHIEARFFQAAMDGYFQFGTLAKYRASENALAGRLGDPEESRIQDVFMARKGFIERFEHRALSLKGASFSGNRKDIVIETYSNDYCACLSLGPFSKERAIKFRENEADETRRPSAFVTYDLRALRISLTQEVKAHERLEAFGLLGRSVDYGIKDRKWSIEDSFVERDDRDALAIWLGIAFVKDTRFSLEEEYRLLLLNPRCPGQLPLEEGFLRFPRSKHISNAIVDSGLFWKDGE